MLRYTVEHDIGQWTFKTPLPIAAQTTFTARYKFSLHVAEDDLDDDLSGPPFTPCCGDMISNAQFPDPQVTGEVRSVDGTQTIDVTAVATAAVDRCPDDKEKHPPTTTDGADFVELHRNSNAGGEYLVRVYRSGGVEWNGLSGVASLGFLATLVNPAVADALLARFLSDDFWSACPGERLPVPNPPVDGEEQVQKGDFLDVSIGGHRKLVDVDPEHSDPMVKLAWTVDGTLNTHQWRHGEPSSESLANMRGEFQFPKSGVTRLMRATYRFDRATAEMTVEPLKRYLAAGDDVNAADESGWTALMYAAALTGDDTPNVRLLLEAHADPNRASLHGFTALMMAAYFGEFRHELLDFGAKIDARNADGVTTLMLLAEHARPDVLEEALQAGADATIRDDMGRNALDYLLAASCGRAIIPLPKATGVVLRAAPPLPCPPEYTEFRHSRALLEAAMHKKANR